MARTRSGRARFQASPHSPGSRPAWYSSLPMAPSMRRTRSDCRAVGSADMVGAGEEPGRSVRGDSSPPSVWGRGPGEIKLTPGPRALAPGYGARYLTGDRNPVRHDHKSRETTRQDDARHGPATRRGG